MHRRFLDLERLEELIDELDDLGSSNDPIWFSENRPRHLDMVTPHDLVELRVQQKNKYFSIWKKFYFFCEGGEVGYGTIKQMIEERREDAHQ